jgi:hypothetical protein
MPGFMRLNLVNVLDVLGLSIVVERNPVQTNKKTIDRAA